VPRLVVGACENQGVRNPTGYAEIEHWFLKRGLPHFIDGYSARRDVLTRALPVLTFIFLVEVVNAPKKSFSIWLDVVAVVGGFAILLGAWALVNRLRGRRPLQRPDDIGLAEVAVFVVVPALLPVVFGQQYASAGVTAALNMVLVSVVYFTTSYGVVPTVRWGIGKIGVQLEAISALLVRALPLLALFVTFFFLTAEVWQSAGITTGVPYWIAISLFVAVGVFFVLMRMPADLNELGTFATWDEVGVLVRGTPAERGYDDDGDPNAAIALSRRQRANVVLVVLFSQAVQIVFVSVAVGLFFSLLGFLLVPRATIASWTGIEPDALHVLMSWHIGDRELLITDPTLRVAGFVTAFAGLQFTMSVLTDAHYRAEFREEIVGEIRQAFAVRAVYLDQRAEASPSP
jgi:hypothetical protein